MVMLNAKKRENNKRHSLKSEDGSEGQVAADSSEGTKTTIAIKRKAGKAALIQRRTNRFTNAEEEMIMKAHRRLTTG